MAHPSNAQPLRRPAPNPRQRQRQSMPSRRNALIRTVSALTGDLATGVALASACLWLIESAALGLFLSFLLWLVAIFLGLAISQYLVQPAVQALLSDRKLDEGVVVAIGMLEMLANLNTKAREGLWSSLQQGVSSIRWRFQTQ